MMNELGIRARRALAEDYAPFQRLQELDAIWSEVAEGKRLAEGDHEDAITLLEDLDSVLGTCIEKARNLRQQVGEYPDLAGDVLRTLLAETPPDPGIAPLGGDARRYWEDELRAWEGEAPRLIDTVFGRLANRVLPEERETVRQRIQSLRGSGEVETDINPCTTCGIGIAGALVYGAAGLWPIAFGLAAGAGYYCGRHSCLWNGRPEPP
jgi:hypothetical protein